MNALFYYTGALVWLLVAAGVSWIVFELILAVVAGISFSRFSARCARAEGSQVSAWETLCFFWRRWYTLIGHRADGRAEYYRKGGSWRGINNMKFHDVVNVAPITPAWTSAASATQQNLSLDNHSARKE